ncbi:NAD(P)H-hydrate epimerase, partial [Prescottella equi]|uniref:NAD(P)H-hydrate epimerase n=1 Tax=Rhodococcus hoagii TaxID=43767 RepID=UPI00301BF823
DGTLMGRAAHGLARVAAGELPARTGGVVGRRVTLLVGSGDNGGDALWAGALLRRRGVAVTAVLLNPDRAHPAGLAALQAAGGRVSPDPGDPDLVLDGIVGISGTGPLRPAAAAIVAQLDAPIVAVDLPSGVDPDTGAVTGPLRPAAAAIVAQLDAPIVAVDLPSGVDPDTGAVDGPAVTAAVTVAFGALKPVHALAAARCGRVELVPIGLTLPEADLQALDPWEVGRLWPVPHAADDKYTQGVVGVVAGSRRYPGAAVLSAGAAVTATAGMVRYAGRAADEVV